MPARMSLSCLLRSGMADTMKWSKLPAEATLGCGALAKNTSGAVLRCVRNLLKECIDSLFISIPILFQKVRDFSSARSQVLQKEKLPCWLQNPPQKKYSFHLKGRTYST